MAVDKNFGIYLKDLRLGKGLTLKELDAQTGVSFASISRIEDSKQEPTPDTLKKLAPALGVSVEELMLKCGYLPPGITPIIACTKDGKVIEGLQNIIQELNDKQLDELKRIAEVIKLRDAVN
jgi:transcriptional regulator with XRE-family HTH domain